MGILFWRLLSHEEKWYQKFNFGVQWNNYPCMYSVPGMLFTAKLRPSLSVTLCGVGDGFEFSSAPRRRLVLVISRETWCPKYELSIRENESQQLEEEKDQKMTRLLSDLFNTSSERRSHNTPSTASHTRPVYRTTSICRQDFVFSNTGLRTRLRISSRKRERRIF